MGETLLSKCSLVSTLRTRGGCGVPGCSTDPTVVWVGWYPGGGGYGAHMSLACTPWGVVWVFTGQGPRTRTRRPGTRGPEDQGPQGQETRIRGPGTPGPGDQGPRTQETRRPGTQDPGDQENRYRGQEDQVQRPVRPVQWPVRPVRPVRPVQWPV